jgi:hypothetical protein
VTKSMYNQSYVRITYCHYFSSSLHVNMCVSYRSPLRRRHAKCGLPTLWSSQSAVGSGLGGSRGPKACATRGPGCGAPTLPEKGRSGGLPSQAWFSREKEREEDQKILPRCQDCIMHARKHEGLNNKNGKASDRVGS